MSNPSGQVASVQAKLRNKSKALNIDNSIVIHKYFIDCFLEKLSKSAYSQYFVLKGGFVLSAITGLAQRTTLDVDALLNGVALNEENLKKMVETIIKPENGEVFRLEFAKIVPIQKEKAYQGLEVHMQGVLGNVHENFHVDTVTGETLDPSAIDLSYDPILGNKKITILRYRTERMLAEKLQTVLELSTLNSRMKDFYDVYLISKLEQMDEDLLATTFQKLMNERNTQDLWTYRNSILDMIAAEQRMTQDWQRYAARHKYVGQLTFGETLDIISNYFSQIDRLLSSNN